MKFTIEIKSVLLLCIILCCFISDSFSLSSSRSRSKKSHSRSKKSLALNKRKWLLFSSSEDKIKELLIGANKYNCNEYVAPINKELKALSPKKALCFNCVNDDYFKKAVDYYNNHSPTITVKKFIEILGEKMHLKFFVDC